MPISAVLARHDLIVELRNNIPARPVGKSDRTLADMTLMTRQGQFNRFE
jgi:hypothetical protein